MSEWISVDDRMPDGRVKALEALLEEANTILEIGESINPGCVLHSEIKAALAKKELSE